MKILKIKLITPVHAETFLTSERYDISLLDNTFKVCKLSGGSTYCVPMTNVSYWEQEPEKSKKS